MTPRFQWLRCAVGKPKLENPCPRQGRPVGVHSTHRSLMARLLGADVQPVHLAPRPRRLARVHQGRRSLRRLMAARQPACGQLERRLPARRQTLKRAPIAELNRSKENEQNLRLSSRRVRCPKNCRCSQSESIPGGLTTSGGGTGPESRQGRGRRPAPGMPAGTSGPPIRAGPASPAGSVRPVPGFALPRVRKAAIPLRRLLFYACPV